MKILVDAMGSDHAPVPDVAGAVAASRDFGVEVVLVGPEDVVRAELAKNDVAGAKMQVVHASQVVTMTDHTMAVKEKKDSSMVVGMTMLRRGDVDAFVSAGNSGAVMAAALLNLGRLKGILRPALATAYPTVKGRRVVLDIGANTDCKPEYLYQFAIMGRAYAERVLGIPNPTIGLISNGEEEGKGTMLVRDTYELFKHSPFDFRGNVEGKDVPMGLTDVMVCDGFTGNVAIKLSEGLVKAIARMAKSMLSRGWQPKAAGVLMLPGLVLCVPGLLLMLPTLKNVIKGFDPEEVGGAPLLGVRGPVIIAHGRSNAKAIRSAVRAAKQALDCDVLGAITAGLEQFAIAPSS
jgi:glycerol-3-phosphate acyltransferase PlsX